ncbi:MAG: protein CapI, partial [Colwellia sp.]|nr:protein CapI [Colwellia sp.]
NLGDMQRDFTDVDDIVEGIIRIQDTIPQKNNDWKVESNSVAESSAPYKIFNIGNGNPVKLLDFIQSLEDSLNIKADKNFMPMQAGDVYQTFADVEDLFNAVKYKPSTSVQNGVSEFVGWYKNFTQMQ